jgi:hypothetical protein
MYLTKCLPSHNFFVRDQVNFSWSFDFGGTTVDTCTVCVGAVRNTGLGRGSLGNGKELWGFGWNRINSLAHGGELWGSGETGLTVYVNGEELWGAGWNRVNSFGNGEEL